jgi:hypothetical protein
MHCRSVAMNMEHDLNMCMAIGRIRDDLFEGMRHSCLLGSYEWLQLRPEYFEASADLVPEQVKAVPQQIIG